MKKALLLFILIMAPACSMKPQPPLMYPNEYASEGGGANLAGENMRFMPSSEAKISADRLIISDATITIESQEPDTIHIRVIDMASRFGGYVLYTEKRLTRIRIPSTGLRDAIKEIESLGKVKDKNITGQDVTDEYRDYKIRLDNAEKTRQRYLALLDMAKNVEEVLSVERELERLNTEIDLLKGKIDRLSHLVKYSTITVRTRDEIRPGPVGHVFYGLYQGIKWLFVWD